MMERPVDAESSTGSLLQALRVLQANKEHTSALKDAKDALEQAQNDAGLLQALLGCAARRALLLLLVAPAAAPLLALSSATPASRLVTPRHRLTWPNRHDIGLHALDGLVAECLAAAAAAPGSQTGGCHVSLGGPQPPPPCEAPMRRSVRHASDPERCAPCGGP